MKKITNVSTANKFLSLATIILILTLFVPITSFEDLIYAEGRISKITLKKNGVGALIEIKTTMNEYILSTVTDLKENENMTVRALKNNDFIEIWYVPSCCIQDVWQLKKNENLLKKYEESLSRAKIGRNILGVFSFILFVISLVLFWKKKRKINETEPSSS